VKTVIGTVIYQAGLPYLAAFIKSVNQQTDLDFEVIIINDNLPILPEILNQLQVAYEVIPSKIPLNIFSLRKQLIQEAYIRSIHLLILADMDDVMDSQRVYQTKKAYTPQISFFYNEIYVLGGQAYFKGKLPKEVTSVQVILQSNFLGLSNTALNLPKVGQCVAKLKEATTEVFDWYLYTHLLLNGHAGRLVQKTRTYYRLYQNNLGQLSKASMKERVLKELEVKYHLYQFFSPIKPIYKKKRARIEKLKQQLTAGATIENILTEERHNYWWELIKEQNDGEN